MMHGLSRDTRRALRRAKRRRGAELNIVSMIDILTVLVFFLLVNSIGVSILGVNLPDANAAVQTPPPHALSVTVRGSGLLVSDLGSPLKAFPKKGETYPIPEVAALLREIKARLPEEQNITLLLEAGVPYEVLIAVMDAVRTDSTARGKQPTDLFPNISLGDAPPEAGAAR